ncbi:hypothetical protein [Microseira wollei]|nr:hypothetical protein [Microseira wollei]
MDTGLEPVTPTIAVVPNNDLLTDAIALPPESPVRRYGTVL